MKNLTMYNDETLKWTHNGKRYCLHIQADDIPEDPRNYDGNICTLACWHKGYSLGDDIGKVDMEEYFRKLVRENVPEEEILSAALNGKIQGIRAVKTNDDVYDIYEEYYLRTPLGNSESDETLEYEGIEGNWIVDYITDDLTPNQAIRLLRPYAEIVPLWLYDHSGITMSCGKGNPFSDNWDSGCVGYAIVLKDKIIAERLDWVLDENGERVKEEYKHENSPSTYSYKTKPLTDETWRDAAERCIEYEVKTYDQYLTGDICGYTLYEAKETENDEEQEWEVIDSCWGFYGSDIIENGIVGGYVDDGLIEAIESGEYEIGEAKHQTRSYYTF